MLKSLTPGQTLVKVVNDELIRVMGVANDALNLNVPPPAVILMAGLQGSGKTTSSAKLALWLRERARKPCCSRAVTSTARPPSIS